MRALFYTDTQTVEVRDTDEPAAMPGEAIVEIEAVGICGSDMHAYLGHDPRRVPPLILGHEVAGTATTGQLQGRRVVLNPLITCGACDACLGGRANLCGHRELIGMNRPGGFAQRIAIPERNLIAIPDDMNAAHAALTEPAATALHAVHLASRAAARPLAELDALVIGAGSVGLFAALLLLDQGATRVTVAETNALRRRTAGATSVNRVIDPTTQEVGDSVYDLVIDAVGGEHTRNTAVSAVRAGGTIMHIGLLDNDGSLDVRKLTLSEITFIGTYTYTHIDLRATVKKLYDGALGTLDWVESRPLAEGAAAFDDLLHGRCASPKVLLNP